MRRRGYLGETSFVTIAHKNKRAKAGEDFKDNYATQVQFRFVDAGPELKGALPGSEANAE